MQVRYRAAPWTLGVPASKSQLDKITTHRGQREPRWHTERMKPLPRRVMLTFFAVVAVVSALVAVAQVVTPVFITLPGGDGAWRCGSLPRLLSGTDTGYHGGEQDDGVYEFVLANCRPAAFRALAGGIIAILAAAMATVLFIVRRRTP